MRVELEQVGKSVELPLGYVSILHGIDLVLEEGGRYLIRGPSGCGKTTLLNIVGGLARPTSGTIRYRGGEAGAGSRSGISFAFQIPYFLPGLSVRENLLAPACCRPQNFSVTGGENLLELLGLADQADLAPEELSGGEQRRLEVARALMGAPRLLLLDEPLAYLDAVWQERVLALIIETCRVTEATLVMASSGAVPGSENFRQIRLRKGKVHADGTSYN